ncbi:M23 family metallopeptidase [Hyphomicrobiales bacterium BP6-180914]|uniref:M23 family metallopeptidase n=1 Tax=Lichenifustis flavocetrariae TaxID=2949735 RepID=A0AA41Z0P5_9HYPH|nr:M23 family metallopeptidase [Lichenifustis flavocetrariae]MCW6507152.1 M23 family metallopeptidase [Lichenifustis flavocetrariae]
MLIDLGVEPPIEASGRQHAAFDRRRVSLRWLLGTVMTGVAGAGLIGSAIYGVLDRGTVTPQQPDYVANSPSGARDSGEALKRADRLVKSADIVAEKQTFAAPVTITVGDKQVLRTQNFTRVSTTLTLAPTGFADQVPDFNPLKLLAGDEQAPADTPIDPGPALDDSDVSFTTHDLASIDPARYAGALGKDEVQAQVSEYLRTTGSGSDALSVLPAQLLLMRTTRATMNFAGTLSYATPENPLANPFSSIEVKMVPENVTVVQQSSRNHDGADSSERLVVLHHGETLESVLRANGADPDQIHAIVTAFGAKRGEAPVAEGRRLKLLIARPDGRAAGQIVRLSVYADETLETTVAMEDVGDYVQVSRVDTKPLLKAAPKDDDDDDGDTGGMRLYESLYETALKQNVPKSVIDDLVRIFGNDVDFQRSVSAGDTFDAFYSDGEDHDDLLFASITVRNEVYRYYRFQDPTDGTTDFFDENGRSTRKFLIRKPVPVGEVTSGFGMRFHPILGYSRPHTGVDWGAPIGTPILAAGSGVILTAERSSSYGNHIEIQHPNGYVTTYSHMSGFARGIVDGLHVRQGQVIGYLGQTGLATGPHLHYEVIVNGHFVDPMRVKLARTREMDGKTLASFKKEHDRIDTLMASAPNAVPETSKHAAAN